MSTKGRHAAAHWRSMLKEARDYHGHMVSAGEVAKFAGTCRNTAKRYLDALVDMGLIMSYLHPAKNKLESTYYDVLERYQ